MIDAGCGPAVVDIRLSKEFQLEIIAFDMSFVIDRAYQQNKSNLCHFVQGSVLSPPFQKEIADITYSHGVLHHTSSTKKAFEEIAQLTKPNGILYVWLYGKKKGWNRFRFIFIRLARFIISRLPKYLQTFMIYVVAGIVLIIRFFKRLLGMEKVKYKTMNQFLVGIRDKFTPKYAREHTEAEVKQWFINAGYKEVNRRTKWEKTKMWVDSTDLSISGIRKQTRNITELA